MKSNRLGRSALEVTALGLRIMIGVLADIEQVNAAHPGPAAQ